MLEKIGMALSVGQNVAGNVLVIIFLMLIGFLLTKKGILTDAGIKQINELVLRVAIPCLIINAYQREFDPAMAKNLGLALVFSIIIHIMYIFIATVVFKTRPDKKDRIRKFCVIYSNCGFMALPLINAVYGSVGVFYGVAYLTVFNVLYWTHGTYLYTGDFKELSIKKIACNPGVMGTALGLFFFFAQITLPAPIGKTVDFLAALNTPLPMIVLGTYLVNLNIKSILKDGSLWAVSALRLLILPVLTILLLKVFNFELSMSMPIVFSCACPAAAAATLFAIRYGLDSEYASQMCSFTTLVSAVTIPVVMMIATVIL